MASATTVDRFGRVVIPKKTRDRFGLEPGAVLEVATTDDGILLRPTHGDAPLRLKGKVLVFSGEVLAEAEQAIARHREERLRSLVRRSKR